MGCYGTLKYQIDIPVTGISSVSLHIVLPYEELLRFDTETDISAKGKVKLNLPSGGYTLTLRFAVPEQGGHFAQMSKPIIEKVLARYERMWELSELYVQQQLKSYGNWSKELPSTHPFKTEFGELLDTEKREDWRGWNISLDIIGDPKRTAGLHQETEQKFKKRLEQLIASQRIEAAEITTVQRSENGPMEVKPNEPLSAQEKKCLAPYLDSLMQTLPELERPFADRKVYHRLMMDLF